MNREDVMRERFTERMRRTVYSAREEARKLGEAYVSTEHLLLGLAREEGSVAAKVLTLLGVDLSDVRERVERHVSRGDGRAGRAGEGGQLTPRARRVIELAHAEARLLDCPYIGTEHLLLGLIREGECVTAGILDMLGADLDSARVEVAKLYSEASREKPRVKRVDHAAAEGVGHFTGLREQADSHVSREGGIMWQRCTERARRVVFSAQEEAGKLGENQVSTEHLLLGVVREEDSVAADILARLGLSLERIRGEIERQVGRGDGRVGQDMQLSPRAKRVIDLAYDEARRLNNNYIGTEHLLLGLLREGEGLAGRILVKLGADLDRARGEVVKLQPGADRENQGVFHGPPVTTADAPQRATESEEQPGDLGVARADGRGHVEMAMDGETFLRLVAVFQARDAHGYRAMVQGDQTMFLLPAETPVKYLAPTPPDDGAARRAGGVYVRVLGGEYEGYAGWTFAHNVTRTGPDESPFPPPLD